MTTLPPPGTIPFPDDSIEKKIYVMVNKFEDYLPIPNDRNRLAFKILENLSEDGDDILTTIKNCKLKLDGLKETELAEKLSSELSRINN